MDGQVYNISRNFVYFREKKERCQYCPALGFQRKQNDWTSESHNIEIKIKKSNFEIFELY